MKSPLRTLSVSVLGLTLAALVGVGTAGSASAHTLSAPHVAVHASSTGVAFTGLVGTDSWSWGGAHPNMK